MNSPDDNGLASGDTATRVQPVKRSSGRALTKTTLALLASVSLAVVAAGGTYAYLNSAATVSDAVTITSGTAALTVDSTLAGLTTLFPGITTYGTAAISNSGNVALVTTTTISSAGSTVLSQDAQLAIGVVSAAGDCKAGFVGAGPVGAISLGTLAPGQSKTLCVAITLPITATPGSENTEMTLNFTMSGKQPS